VKSEGRVFMRNIEFEKEITALRATPERVKAIFDQILTDVFDTFFFSPY
jgi:predicted HAD superfamily phosphohydrolase YqeG